jgi:hypothetical protein
MDGIEIINFARKPGNEVWFLRVTTISKNYIPVTKTAYRRINTPKEKLIDDLILMIRGRLNAFVGVIDEDTDEPMSLEEAGFNFYLNFVGSSRQNIKDWYDEEYEEILQGPFEWFMNGAGGENPEGTIDCIITNGRDNDKYSLDIIPSWLSRDERPPKAFSVPPSEKGNTVTLFVKCVRVKVK